MPGATNFFGQTFTNRELPIGVAGDWNGANIRANVPVGPWALVAPPSGTTVGGIGWANPATGICSSYFQPASFAGFVGKAMQGLIYNFLGVASMQIPEGFMVTDFAQGDFLGVFQSGATALQKVYASPTTGALTAAATGAGVTITGSTITLTTGGLLTVAGSPSGTIAVGQIVAAVGVPPGTYIVSEGSGTGGTGTYNVANLDGTPLTAVAGGTTASFYGAQETQFFVTDNVAVNASFTATLAAETGQAPFGVLTVSAFASGQPLAAGQWISSGGSTPVPITANIRIIEQLTSTDGGALGNTGTYLVSNNITVASGQTFAATQGQLGGISSLVTAY